MSRARSASPRVIAVLIGCGLVLQAGSAAAWQSRAGAGTPWPDDVVGTLRSFFERVDVASVLDGVRAPAAAEGGGDPVGLANRLPRAAEAPFRYVQAVTHRAYAGALLGARGTALAGAGNALDQSLLLAAIHAARGDRTRLVRGRLRWSDAVALVGREPDALQPGDPWLRQVELAADHWWVELSRGADWVALDPSFPDSRWGEARGSVRSVHDEVPAAQQARLSLEVAGPRGPVGRTELPLAELVGRPFDLRVVRYANAPADDEAPGEPAANEDALDRYLAARRVPVAAVRLRAGGRELDMPVDSPAPLSVRLELRYPVGQPETLEFSLRPERLETAAVVLHSGDVSGRLGTRSAAIFGALQRLARLERETLEAWIDRPRPEGETDRDDTLAPPEPTDGPEEAPELEPHQVRHPSRALHLGALEAWDVFDAELPELLGLATLAATDRLRRPVGAAGMPVRAAVVRWTPPAGAEAGRFSVWTVDGVDPRSRNSAGTRAAGDFLHSALLGQVLHSLADQAPATAFDVTLRSVGTGQRLAWWGAGDDLPRDWPGAARRRAAFDRDQGRLLVGPPEAVSLDEQAVRGWWAVDAGTGATRGRVAHGDDVLEATVGFAAPLDPESLESVLASLPAFHRAVRWILAAADPRTEAVGLLVPRACAATALVGDLLAAGAPPRFPVPVFGPYCGAAGRASGATQSPAAAYPRPAVSPTSR